MPIDRIVPLTDARDNFSRLVADVESIEDGLYVLTKGGKPAIALINIKYLEEIMTGQKGKSVASPTPSTTPPKSNDILPKPAPIVTNDQPKPVSSTAPISQPKSFEPPKPSIPASAPPPLKTESNYDVKPTVNPSWTGETPKMAPTGPAPSSVTPPPPPKPDSVNSAPMVTSSPATKPAVNPWPIIPPKPVLPDTPPPAVPSTPKPISQPAAPTSFQNIPVPINGGGNSTGAPTPAAAPATSLPPPPAVNQPAPFATQPATSASTPTPPSAGIVFDEPPKTSPEPGEAMPPKTNNASAETPEAVINKPVEATTPTQPASVQDVEI